MVTHASDIFKLTGKVAIITGGSRGIGEEIAVGLGEAGAKVVITARREEWLAPTCEEMKHLGIECLALRADITKVEDVERIMVETLRQWGKIDILVNNAGITWGALPEDMPLDKWDAVLNTNAKGTLICSQQVFKEMKKSGGGNIINVTSTTGLLAVDPRVMQAIAYQASKAAIAVMTRQFAVEWAKYNIRVNAIAPFFFRTRMSKSTVESSEKEMIEHVPMGRLGMAGEIKGAAIFLASEASSYITGQVIAIDGGQTAW
ncbi:MAG: glucose 1-dehydrogenase [Dehalococcoidia bacterium]|nr:glucose 1-dehydrogenase [Dehalococcoidia bacterium]